MNNLQLALLLEQYRIRLIEASDEIENDLPEELKWHGKNMLGHATLDYPCMAPLYRVTRDISDAVDDLKKNHDAV